MAATLVRRRDRGVRVILSSGSTGSPKAVAITRCVLIARIAEHARDLAITENSRVMPVHVISGRPGYWTSLAVLAAGGHARFAQAAASLRAAC
jgi:non-ribosomal peptide synthetase component F